MNRILLAAFALLLWAPKGHAAPVNPGTVLEVGGDVTKPRAWTLAQLQKAAPIQTIRTTLKGKPYVVRGVKLWSLIEAASPKLAPKVKHSEARFVVLARGKDGYKVSFALPDLMPDTGNESAFLVWEANGKPLPAKDGPLRLVLPDDKKPMRWVYSLAALEIYDGARLTLPPK